MTHYLRWIVSVWFTVAAAAAQAGWQLMHPITTPPARSEAHITYDLQRNLTILFGGSSATTRFMNDTWAWDGVNWSLLTTVRSPDPRFAGALAFDAQRGRAVLFGGQRAGPPGPGVPISMAEAGDTWEYDGYQWIPMAVSGPAPRHAVAMTFDAATGKVILFGGVAATTAATTVFGDTWTWDGLAWQQLAPAHSPAARFSHAMVTDLRRGVLMHGGLTSSSSSRISETWVWDGTDWNLVPTTTVPRVITPSGLTFDWGAGTTIKFGGYPTGDPTWLFAEGNWIQHLTTPEPPQRWGCSLAYEVARGQSVLFGGLAAFGGEMSDTWIYRAPVIGAWSTLGVGCAGSAGVPHLEPIARSRPVIGTTFPLELTNVRNGIVAFAIGLSTSVWRGVPLPAAMDGVGMTGCTVYCSDDIVEPTTAVGGRAAFAINVPPIPALAGITFAIQAFAMDPTANALGAVLSNAASGKIGAL